MQFHQTIGLAPSPSSTHYKLRSRKTRGPDVAASVSRLSCMRCHDNLKVTRLNSNTESRTNITIRARNPYIYTKCHTYTNSLRKKTGLACQNSTSITLNIRHIFCVLYGILHLSSFFYLPRINFWVITR